MTPRALRVLVADARPRSRTSLAERLHGTPEIAEVLEAATTEAAFRTVRAGPPIHVAVWGLRGWQEALSRFGAERPELPVLILSDLRERETAVLALRDGAAGFVDRRRALDELPTAVCMAADGKHYLSPAFAEILAEAVAEGRDLSNEGALAGLSSRETQAARLVAQGLTTREIAAEMAVQPSSVTTFIRRARMKLGLESRMELVLYVLRHGLVANEPREGE
ncbi:MAG: response regulator transcription factor [Bacteroidota bacterium]